MFEIGREKRSFTEDFFLSICGNYMGRIFLEFEEQKEPI